MIMECFYASELKKLEDNYWYDGELPKLSVCKPCHKNIETKPLKCPFCGKTPKLNIIYHETCYTAEIRCKCGATMESGHISPVCGAIEDVIQKWNTRRK